MNTTLIKEFVQFVKKDAKDTDNCMVSNSLKRFVTYKELEDILDKTGYWKVIDTTHIYGDKGGESCYCSKCGSKGTWTKFCANCGARMVGDAE